MTEIVFKLSSGASSALVDEILASTLRQLRLAGLGLVAQREALEALLDSLDRDDEAADAPAARDYRHWSARIPDTDDIADDPKSLLEDEFNAQDFSKALARLRKRTEIIYELDDEDIPRGVAICSELLPLIRQAQAWITENAQSRGVTVVGSRDEWIKTASDDDLDKEDAILFLDENYMTNDFQLSFFSRVSQALVVSCQFEELAAFHMRIKDAGVDLGPEVTRELAGHFGAIGEFRRLEAALAACVAGSELPQSAFVTKFTQDSASDIQSYVVEGWLRHLAKKGVLTVQKKSNRWTIVVK